MDVTDAMIVAGGRGTRLQPLTHGVPKPLLPFCGEPFLIGVIERLALAGVHRVFLVVGADTEPFEVLREPARQWAVEVVMVPEPAPLDTAGGVREAVEQVDGPFLVLNGDVLTDLDFGAAIRRHAETGADATLTLTRVEDTSSFGVCVMDGDGMVTRFVEKPAPGTLPGQDAINAGTYVLEPEALLAFDRGRLSFERAVFPGILERGGRIAGLVWDGVWGDLGTPDRWRWGHRAVLDGSVAWPPVQAVPERAPRVRVHAGAAVDVRATLVEPVLVLDGATVGPGAVLGPNVVVGRSVHVGEGVHLQDSMLGDAASVGDGVRTRGLIAGPGVVVGARARLGDDIVLGAGAQVRGGEVLPAGARRPTPLG